MRNANLITDRAEDGIARHSMDTDVSRIANEKREATYNEGETALGDAV